MANSHGRTNADIKTRCIFGLAAIVKRYHQEPGSRYLQAATPPFSVTRTLPITGSLSHATQRYQRATPPLRHTRWWRTSRSRISSAAVRCRPGPPTTAWAGRVVLIELGDHLFQVRELLSHPGRDQEVAVFHVDISMARPVTHRGESAAVGILAAANILERHAGIAITEWKQVHPADVAEARVRTIDDRFFKLDGCAPA